ncbi:MAG: helix-turn-helix domain-containing protein [Deltaproteobacteria bacterium]|nr:helix-turn-helix domain-containing protein [Deltaproteobacteria bacterium]
MLSCGVRRAATQAWAQDAECVKGSEFEAASLGPSTLEALDPVRVVGAPLVCSVYQLDFALRRSRSWAGPMKIDAREVARLLSVSETGVYRWTDSGELPCYRVNHQPRFARSELLEWATERRVSITRELLVDEDGGSSATLTRALDHGGVFTIAGARSEDALAEAIDKLPIPDPHLRETLLKVWIARPSLGSNLVRDGVAIPRARRPVVISGAPPTLSAFHFEHPVLTPPIRTLIVIVSSTMRAHLELLARLSRAVEDSTFMETISKRLGYAELVAATRRVDELLGGES